MNRIQLKFILLKLQKPFGLPLVNVSSSEKIIILFWLCPSTNDPIFAHYFYPSWIVGSNSLNSLNQLFYLAEDYGMRLTIDSQTIYPELVLNSIAIITGHLTLKWKT